MMYTYHNIKTLFYSEVSRAAGRGAVHGAALGLWPPGFSQTSRKPGFCQTSRKPGFG